jgi:hypothetical protein
MRRSDTVLQRGGAVRSVHLERRLQRDEHAGLFHADVRAMRAELAMPAANAELQQQHVHSLTDRLAGFHESHGEQARERGECVEVYGRRVPALGRIEAPITGGSNPYYTDSKA